MNGFVRACGCQAACDPRQERDVRRKRDCRPAGSNTHTHMSSAIHRRGCRRAGQNQPSLTPAITARHMSLIVLQLSCHNSCYPSNTEVSSQPTLPRPCLPTCLHSVAARYTAAFGHVAYAVICSHISVLHRWAACTPVTIDHSLPVVAGRHGARRYCQTSLRIVLN